jgi:hypothetical protein
MRDFIKKTFSSARGQSMVESTICMLLICLIMFGLLQVFYLAVAQMLTKYSAFCAARSYSVGFTDYLLRRSARIGVIGASGNMCYPENDSTFDGPLSQFAVEKLRIPEYINGDRYLDYEIGEEGDANYWSWSDGGVSFSYQTEDGTVGVDVTLADYPLNFPMRATYTSLETIDISGSARVMNYSQNYLMETE